MSKTLEKIRDAVRNFKTSDHIAIEECMLITGTQNKTFYKAGIFFCSTPCQKRPLDIVDFWVESFFCLIENTWMGNFFNEMVPPLIQWRKVSSEEFSNTYFYLIRNYQPEPSFQEQQAYEGTRVEFEKIVFSKAFKVLDTGPIKSAVAKTGDNRYVSYFIIDETIGEQYGWDIEETKNN